MALIHCAVRRHHHDNLSSSHTQPPAHMVKVRRLGDHAAHTDWFRSDTNQFYLMFLLCQFFCCETEYSHLFSCSSVMVCDFVHVSQVDMSEWVVRSSSGVAFNLANTTESTWYQVRAAMTCTSLDSVTAQDSVPRVQLMSHNHHSQYFLFSLLSFSDKHTHTHTHAHTHSLFLV